MFAICIDPWGKASLTVFDPETGDQQSRHSDFTKIAVGPGRKKVDGGQRADRNIEGRGAFGAAQGCDKVKESTSRFTY